MKPLILYHPKLFYTGISDDGASSSDVADVLCIENISENIKWTDEELVKLYSKLSVSLNRLVGSKWFDFKDGFMPINYTPLLDEMYSFLRKYKNKLESQPNFGETFTLAENALIEKRGFETIDEALISDEQNTVYMGINLLIDNIDKNGVNANSDSIHLLLDSIALKRSKVFLTSISGVSYLLEQYESFICQFENKLELILGVYKDNVLSQMDVNIPKIYFYVINIASALEKHGSKSEIVEYWLGIKESKRYNFS